MLEAVEVDEQHRELVAPVPDPARQRAIQALLEQRPVGQLGQVVVNGVVNEALVRRAQAHAHRVERPRHGGGLGRAAHRQLQREIAGGDLGGRRGDVAQRAAQVAAEEHAADQRQHQGDHAGQRETHAQRVDELLGQRPVRQHEQPARVAPRDVGLQREHAGHVLPPAHAEDVRLQARRVHRHQPHGFDVAAGLVGQARRHDDAVDDQRHLASRQPGQLAGDVVGQAIAGGQRADDLVTNPRRHGDDDEEAILVLYQRAGGTPATCGVLGVAHDVQAGAGRVPPAGAAEPGAVGRRHDGEIGLHLSAVDRRHSVHRRAIASAVAISEAAVERRQLRDQRGLVDGRGDAEVEQGVERGSGDLEIGGDPVARLARHNPRGHQQHRAQGHGDQQPECRGDARLQPPVPWQLDRNGFLGGHDRPRHSWRRAAAAPAAAASVSQTLK